MDETTDTEYKVMRESLVAVNDLEQMAFSPGGAAVNSQGRKPLENPKI
jgi:hypothetical protein